MLTWTALPQLGFDLFPSVAADSLTTLDCKLPTPRDGTSAVYTGSKAYVFGGYGDYFLNSIIEYSPGGCTRSMSAVLPTIRRFTTAVWDPTDRPSSGCPGGCAYLFGGEQRGTSDNEVHDLVRYNPTLDQTTTIRTGLPTASESAAVWDSTDRPGAGCPGGCAYVFNIQDHSTNILQYNPSGNTWTILSTSLPDSASWAAAVWDPRDRPAAGCAKGCAYISWGPGVFIQKFNPSTSTASRTTTRSECADDAEGIWDGSNAYFLAGTSVSHGTICRYNPATNVLGILGKDLSPHRFRTSAVWTGQSAYIFGGVNCVTPSTRCDAIVQYTPDPGPCEMIADAGPLYTGFVYSAIPFSGSLAAGGACQQPFQFSWTWGDGGSAVGNPVSHTFTSPSNWGVQLTVRDAAGNTAFDDSVAQITVDPTRRPDLVVQALSTSPSVPAEGDPTQITATVTNSGLDPAAPFEVRATLDGTEIAGCIPACSWSISSLAGGASTGISATFTPLAGDHVLALTADWRTQVDETDESNNAASRIFQSPKALDMVQDWTELAPGKPATVTVTVANAAAQPDLFTSRDEGATWTHQAMPTTGYGVYQLQLDAGAPGTKVFAYSRVTKNGHDYTDPVHSQPEDGRVFRSFHEVKDIALIHARFLTDCRAPRFTGAALERENNSLATHLNDYMNGASGSGGAVGYRLHNETGQQPDSSGWVRTQYDCAHYEAMVTTNANSVHDAKMAFIRDALTAASVSPGEFETAIVVSPTEITGTEFDSRATHYHDLRVWPLADAAVINEDYSWGTYAHELGHYLGLADYYVDSCETNRCYGDLGWFDVMGPGQNRESLLWPQAPFSIATRAIMGWQPVTDVNFGYTGPVNAIQTESSVYGDQAWRINGKDYDGQYNFGSYYLESKTPQDGFTGAAGVNLIRVENSAPDHFTAVRPSDTFDCDKFLCHIPRMNLRDAATQVFDDAWSGLHFELAQMGPQPQGPFTLWVSPRVKAGSSGFSLSPMDHGSGGGQALAANVDAAAPELHAIAQDGRHVGLNHSTGEYENQIQGAESSGRVRGGTEWILVPADVFVEYYIENAPRNESFSVQYQRFGNNAVVSNESGRSVVTENVVGRVANLSGENSTVVLDSSPPNITIDSPARGSVTVAGQDVGVGNDRATIVALNATLRFRVDEPESNLTAIEVWLDGNLTVVLPPNAREWAMDSASVPLGSHILEVQAVNEFGLVGRGSIQMLFVSEPAPK